MGAVFRYYRLEPCGTIGCIRILWRQHDGTYLRGSVWPNVDAAMIAADSARLGDPGSLDTERAAVANWDMTGAKA